MRDPGNGERESGERGAIRPLEAPHDELRRTYRARWVFPVSSPPIERGCVVVEGGRIVAVGSRADGPIVDLGDMALLPALINAHTHLEFSDLAQPLGQPSQPLPDWIRSVVAHRRTAASSSPEDTTPRDKAIAAGLRESSEAGVAAVGEIATPPLPDFARTYQASAAIARGESNGSTCRGVLFLELLGLAEERIEPLVAMAREHVRRCKRTMRDGGDVDPVRRSTGVIWRAGLSPHAPYTVHPRLLEESVRIAASSRVPVAMHLAESREELRLLASHRGPFAELLRDLGAWHPASLPRGRKILDYLQTLADAPRSLVIHGNYLADDEMAFLAEHRSRMTVVYCPRTHTYFGHEPYPLGRMLRAGIRIAVGTDSRASNPDLNLFGELREIIRLHPNVQPADVLRMGTIDAARALGLGRQLGSLRPGRPFVAALFDPAAGRSIEPRDHATRDPFEFLFSGDE